MENILEVHQVKKYYKIKTGLLQKSQFVKAVDEVSFSIKKGQTFGLVGESGCGKSTIGKVIIRLEDATSGSIIIDGEDITHLRGKKLRESRQKYQMIFQDPYASLNPMQMVGDIIAEPILNYKKMSKDEVKKEVLYLLKCVGLSEEAYYKYAHEFSGGQRQRVGIARALALRPSLIVADEPVSALDVSVQSQVLNLLKDLQEQFNLSYLFIAHDLSVVKHISDVIGVMYLGHIVEIASDKEIYENPKHPYTKALISSIPQFDKQNSERIILQGELPSPSNPPKGCPFHTRCPIATEKCKTNLPNLEYVSDNHKVACFYVDKVGEING
ncbi:TPA: dipeptide ABC transporter ATP-binding protein [Staphylococcus argenteus]|uniref:ABC transporter ATP-binding protein n=1 Tax=Staphylococcus argenteus TaxID=985002 RepID=UPI000233FED4|nr:dipeptide ABC transporter ATP-binding protein [Staphylococcus argenteus]MBE2130285.1 dipeptide ABC transporter ATP-binding protein [Staphylococcus argenteus]PNY93081.1 dipeptide ABC transporter ATP-binding protein [Staphylococcus argenteus]CCE58695.1 putative oligopeptide transport ATP-binding protein [Staphylococcus argenteus]SUJ07691.1 putative oligopeptide transport ATP-binding protein [Staphylococcus argenteus]HDY9428290.1 dipeptide ABC transporter ATP-binding protein [Staphylococcus ar